MIKSIHSSSKVLAGIRSSDNEVLKRIYHECYPIVRKLVLTNRGNEADIKDILQQGIIVLYEKSMDREFELNCAVSTYIYAVCRNLLLKKIRQELHTIEIEDTHTDLITIKGDIEPETVLTDRQQLLYKLLNEAGESCKEILQLYYFKKLKMEEIARKMNYNSTESAKTQKYKCLKKLRAAAKNLDNE